MSETLVRPPPVLFMPQKQPAKPHTRALKVVSEYEPAGDQPAAIEELQKCVATGMRSASEYLFAQSELKAMEKKEETKRKKEESGPADAEALKTKE